MANRSVWYEIGVAIRKLLFSGSSGSTTPNRQQKTQSNRQEAARPGKRTDPMLKGQSHRQPEEILESPGQFGAGQTRDITAAELRRVRLEYAPQPDGDPDPGEVVWTWVPYVENDGRGKDRPVLIIGRIDAHTVVGCYLSTKQHRDFVPIGTGGWDPQRRESYLSPDRLLRVTHDGMRREGVQIDRARFETAVRGVLAHHGLN